MIISKYSVEYENNWDAVFGKKETTRMTHREPKFWAWDDPECLTHEDIDDAIADYVENDWPWNKEENEVEFCGYVPCLLDETPQHMAERMLRYVYENLDDEYGGDAPDSQPPASVVALAERVAEEVIRTYSVWQCEAVCLKAVNLREWIAKHRPELLEEEGDK